MKVEFKDKFLFINQIEISFPLPISQILEIDDLIIVRLKLVGQGNIERNVMAYNSKGELVWEIQNPDIRPSGMNPCYSFISIKDGQLIAGNTVGYDYIVDLKNGKVTCRNPKARPW